MYKGNWIIHFSASKLVRIEKLVQIIEFKQWRYPQNMNNLGIWDIFERLRWFKLFLSWKEHQRGENGHFFRLKWFQVWFHTVHNDSFEIKNYKILFRIGSDFVFENFFKIPKVEKSYNLAISFFNHVIFVRN